MDKIKFKSTFWKIKLFYKSLHLSDKIAIKSIEITVCISLYSLEKKPNPSHLEAEDLVSWEIKQQKSKYSPDWQWNDFNASVSTS